MANTNLQQASWIWLPQRQPKPNQYVCFRKTFTLPRQPGTAHIYLSVDSNFLLYINGRRIGHGQYSDWPTEKTYTRYRIADTLRRGRNVVSVLAYHVGAHFSTIRRGRPGLIVALQAERKVIVSDASWRACEHRGYQNGPLPHITRQLGFPAIFDARRDFPWWRTQCPVGSWKQAKIQAAATDGFWQSLRPRPVAPLPIGPRVNVQIAFQGTFHRTSDAGTVAECMMKNALITERPADVFAIPEPVDEHDYPGPPTNPGHWLAPSGEEGLVVAPPRRGAHGRFLVIDLGKQRVGMLALALTAPAGTVVDVGHGEHLDDGRVRTAVGGRNFADRYVCAQGHNVYFLPFRRLGARYLQVHLSRFRRPIKLHYVGLHHIDSALAKRGAFACDDPLACRLYNTAVHTLQLSAHEHYEDCPWREQALYSYDGRIQALYGYYAFGGYDYAAACWDLLGRGLRDDGLLELCAPGKVNVNIPIFSLVWITALSEHWLHAGRPRLFNRFRSTIDRILQPMLARHDPATGLYRLSDMSDHWHFYEWTPGLANAVGDRSVASENHAGFNLYLYEALSACAWMAQQHGDARDASALRRRARSLATAIHDVFWDARHGHYATRHVGRSRRDAHEHIQVLALYHGIVPRADRPKLLAKIRRAKLPGMTLSSLMYMARMLLHSNAAGRSYLAELIAQRWHPMALQGATSFWETQHGGDDFFHAGSLCHGWSAAPVYYYQAGVLGITPLTPGFGRFRLSPFPGHLASAAGTVPTPHGAINITWTRRDRGLLVDAQGPAELQPVVTSLPEAPILHARYNRKRVGGCG